MFSDDVLVSVKPASNPKHWVTSVERMPLLVAGLRRYPLHVFAEPPPKMTGLCFFSKSTITVEPML